MPQLGQVQFEGRRASCRTASSGEDMVKVYYDGEDDGAFNSMELRSIAMLLSAAMFILDVHLPYESQAYLPSPAKFDAT